MKGTLALWYEPLDAAGAPGGNEKVRPKVELHLNLWRDLPSGTNFLDIGLLFDEQQHLKRFYLYIPAKINGEAVADLSAILRSGATLNAVFNDVVHRGASGDGWYDIDRSGVVDRVFELERGHYSLAKDRDPVFGDGTIITFNEVISERIQKAGKRAYVRFRVRLEGAAATTFSSDLAARDRAFASSAARLELTEFRLNERRSFPRTIAEAADRGGFHITTIHYFLIRDLEHQLVMQHAPFEKVRRLEAPLWSEYVAGIDPDDPRLTDKMAERLVIYHWKVKEKPAADGGQARRVEDFIAFASFRTTSTSLLFYALVIVLLGACGSLLAAGLTGPLAAGLAALFGPEDGEPWTTTASFVLLVMLFLVIARLAYLAPQVGSLRGRLERPPRSDRLTSK